MEMQRETETQRVRESKNGNGCGEAAKQEWMYNN